MKKAYVKPGMYIENFSLSQCIATDCNIDRENTTLGKPLHASAGQCAWGSADVSIWTNSLATCVVKWGENDPFNGVCYNNPSSMATAFNYS